MGRVQPFVLYITALAFGSFLYNRGGGFKLPFSFSRRGAWVGSFLSGVILIHTHATGGSFFPNPIQEQHTSLLSVFFLSCLFENIYNWAKKESVGREEGERCRKGNLFLCLFILCVVFF